MNLHSNFENWLGQISFNPEIGSLYLSIMEDVFKTNEGDRDTEIKKLNDELKSTDSGFKEYTKYGVSLLSNLKQYYSTASLENKQKMLDLIFPEKLVFSNYEFQTIEPNEILTLLCNGGKGFSDCKKEKSSKNAAHSYMVIRIGLLFF